MFNYFSNVSINRCYGDVYLNLAFTGHGVFPAYFRSFNVKFGVCHCGALDAHVDHVFFNCHVSNDLGQRYSLPRLLCKPVGLRGDFLTFF